MGELSILVIEGVLCELCGVYVGEPCYYPRKCASCNKQTMPKRRKRKRTKENSDGNS